MAKYTFFLDTRYKSKKGELYPLKVQISHNYEQRIIPLDLKLKIEEWDKVNLQVTARHKNYRKLNTFLNDVYERVNDVMTNLRITDGYKQLKASDFADAVYQDLTGKSRNSKKITFVETLKRFIAFKKNNTANLYHQTLKKMEEYDPEVNEKGFTEVSRDWILGFEKHMTDKGNKINYIGIHLRNIRAVFNYAIAEELTTYYPFRKIKIKTEETAKRSLTLEKLRELFNYPVEEYQRKYLDMFKLVFFLCGINSADLFNLTTTHDGRIEYHRAKTNKFYSIKLEPEAQEIIERWRGKKFLLDVCDIYKDYRDFAHRMNLGLRRIGKMHREGRGGKKIIEPAFPGLSIYWARHTWATIADELDIPDKVISLALGHAPENKVTDIYIRRNIKKVDKANRRVIDYVLYGKE